MKNLRKSKSKEALIRASKWGIKAHEKTPLRLSGVREFFYKILPDIRKYGIPWVIRIFSVQ